MNNDLLSFINDMLTHNQESRIMQHFDDTYNAAFLDGVIYTLTKIKLKLEEQ